MNMILELDDSKFLLVRPIFVDYAFFDYSWRCNFVDAPIFIFKKKITRSKAFIVDVD